MLSSIAPDPALTPKIHAAIDATKALLPDRWKELCDQCDPRVTPSGRTFVLPPDYRWTIEELLRTCEWSVCSVPKSDSTFRTFDVQGRLGVVPLKKIPPSEEVVLIDYNGAGMAEAFTRRPSDVAIFVSIVLGYHPQAEDSGVVLDLYPGLPIPVSLVPVPPLFSVNLTAKEALARGLIWAKCLP